MGVSGNLTGGLAIIVSFSVAAEARPRFIDMVRANAVASVQMEAGCRQFDVLIPRGEDAWDVVLYEIYENRAAFETHLASAHFKAFDHATAGIVTAKSVAEFQIAENAGK